MTGYIGSGFGFGSGTESGNSTNQLLVERTSRPVEIKIIQMMRKLKVETWAVLSWKKLLLQSKTANKFEPVKTKKESGAKQGR